MRLSELERESATRPMTITANPDGSGNGGRITRGGDDIRRQVEQLADNEPEVVAQQLRTWMQEG